ncbi:MAG: helix-turn-helix domain-containing protein, partial [Lachnospiraceae bacterium]|nr:helix-turn-helix domain-containing protein [Lachnospiraceae bacterium]
MGFGAVLKDLRKRKGYTQDQVAEYISSHGGKHCIFKTVSHWESGVSSPSVEQFLLMCELYDVGDIQDTFRQAAPGSWGAVKLN